MKSARLLAACLICLVPNANALGVPAIAESIDWALAKSERVVIGKVIVVDVVVDRDEQKCETFTLAVSKTLKGPHEDRVTVVMRSFLGTGDAAKWKADGNSVVVLLVKNDEKRVTLSPEKFPWVVRDDHNHPNVFPLRKSDERLPPAQNMYTRDFKAIREPKVILKYLGNAIADQAKEQPRKGMMIAVPGDSEIFEALFCFSGVYVIVPVDSQLERYGKESCKSELPLARQEGAMILSRFKNDKNIDVLKSLLTDSDTAEQSGNWFSDGKSGEYRKTVYYVRRTAYAALRQLGVRVERPVLSILREGVDEPESGEPVPSDLFHLLSETDED